MNKKFYWLLPVVFILLAACTYLIPKTYTSTFVIKDESEQAIEHNRVMTFNHPENYDLGIIRTDNAFDVYSFKEIAASDEIVRPLLDTQVQTLDGTFHGTYRTYLQEHAKPTVMQRIMKLILPESKGSGNKTLGIPSQKEVEYIKMLEESISTEIDFENYFITISVNTQDPLISQQMAKALRQKLLDYIGQYEQHKMEIGLKQLDILVENAHQEYLKAANADELAEKKAIYESFRRQEVVYKAQMFYHPAFATIIEPTFSYQKATPNRWKCPLLITLLLGCGLVGWQYRKELLRFF